MPHPAPAPLSASFEGSLPDTPGTIIPPDEHQRELTATHILPHLEALMIDFHDLRLAIDHAVAELCRGHSVPVPGTLQLADCGNWRRFRGPPLLQLTRERLRRYSKCERYPLGRCSEITKIVFDYVCSPAIGQISTALHRIRAFSERGGTFKIIWGSIRDVYFQTAFQLGGHYVDVANDTVVLTKPRTDHAPLERSGFKNFSSLEEYARVKAGYHKVDVFLNTFIPDILPFFPLLVINRSTRDVLIEAHGFPGKVAATAANLDFFAPQASDGIDVLDERAVATLVRPFARNEPAFTCSPSLTTADWWTLVARAGDVPPEARATAMKSARRLACFVNHVWSDSAVYERVERWLPR